MSKTVMPVVLSDDGDCHEPIKTGEVIPVDAVPVSTHRKNLLETDDSGLLLTGASLVSGQEHNAIVENVDGKLYLRTKLLLSPDDRIMKVSDNLLSGQLSLRFDAQTSKLALLGRDDTAISELALPVAPGLPTVVEILQDTIPPKPEGFVENPYPRSTYLHMRFRLAGDKSTDIYLDVSKLADIYTAGAGIEITPDKTVSLNAVLKLSGNDFLLLDRDDNKIASVFLPFSDETLTTAEILTDFTPPPEHGQQASSLPESSYLHLHFDSLSGKERDLYVDMKELGASRGIIWIKRVEGVMPEGEALAELIADMPEGGVIYATEGGVVYLTREDTDKLYVSLSGNQSVSGVKTFTDSPEIPTPASGDSSAKAATTAFVSSAIAAIDDVVKLAGDQFVAGVKTFAASPLVPTPAGGDNSSRVANTAFVTAAINKAHEEDDTVVRTTGEQQIDGVKSFAVSPQVPTAPEGTNDLTAASTQFVTGAIARAHASAPTLVRTAGDQSIDGVKSFLKSPLMPTPEAGDNSGKAATTEFVQNAIAGFESPEDWIKRVEGSLPTGTTLDALLEDMPIGGMIYYTDSGEVAVVLTQAIADERYVQLAANQTIAGEKTFITSPRVPTPGIEDSSTKVASTAFVQAVVATVEQQGGGVALTGDQAVAGVKTFTSSPVVPTPSNDDNSGKAANTAYVQSALAELDAADVNAVALSGNQFVGGVKSFTDSPTVPTLDTSDNSSKVASTAYVQAAISALDTPAPGVELTGDQTVAGVKTFIDSPVVPTPSMGDMSGKAATTDFVMNTVPYKVVEGPQPDDVSDLVADMPFGGIIFFTE